MLDGWNQTLVLVESEENSMAETRAGAFIVSELGPDAANCIDSPPPRQTTCSIKKTDK